MNATTDRYDTERLNGLIERHGVEGVLLMVRNRIYGAEKEGLTRSTIDWTEVMGLLTLIYDHISEGRKLPKRID